MYSSQSQKQLKNLSSKIFSPKNYLGKARQMCVKQDNFMSFQIIRPVSGLSGQFLDYPDSLWIVRKAHESSGTF